MFQAVGHVTPSPNASLTSNSPCKPLQDAAIDVLRPKFRKDEETAWTIVKNRLSLQSSKAWPTTLASSGKFSVCSIASVVSYRNRQDKTFTFEDELFLGPVYKRLLIGRLCENPVGRVPSKSTAVIPSAQTIVQDASGRRDQGNTTLHDDDTLALELRQQGIFSRSCQEEILRVRGPSSTTKDEAAASASCLGALPSISQAR
jgi:hypothetical protein